MNTLGKMKQMKSQRTSDFDRYSETNRPVEVIFENGMLIVKLGDGRLIGTPLSWYPKLDTATPDQLNNYELSLDGIHWQELDEDLSVYGMFLGGRSPR
jgi:Protein of unknown function (DUF2442)